MKIQILFTVILLLAAGGLQASNLRFKADSLFDHRADIYDPVTMLADTQNINRAIRLYQKELAQTDSAHIETVWKLMQAYYFKGTYTLQDKGERRDIYSEGIQVGERYLREYPESVKIHCWLGILWGYYAEVTGKLTAARKGVAGKIKGFAEKVIQLDSTYLDAGGYRMLGRAHQKVPKIPLFLGWPSSDKALAYLKKAHFMAPENLMNSLYYAEILAEKDRTDEAKILLQSIINTTDIRHGVLIDAHIKKSAADLLTELENE